MTTPFRHFNTYMGDIPRFLLTREVVNTVRLRGMYVSMIFFRADIVSVCHEDRDIIFIIPST